MYVYIGLYIGHISLWIWLFLKSNLEPLVMRSPLLYQQHSSVGSCCMFACLFLVTLNSQFLLKPMAETNAVFTCFSFLMKLKYVYCMYVCVYIYIYIVLFTIYTFKLIGAFLCSFDYGDGCLDSPIVWLVWSNHPILRRWHRVPEPHVHCKRKIHTVHAFERWW